VAFSVCMPDKPLWLDRLPGPTAIWQIRRVPGWIDLPWNPCSASAGGAPIPIARGRVGTGLVASRNDLIAYLKRIGTREEASYEEERRRQLWARLSRMRGEWIEWPPVLVCADSTGRVA